ncbi:class I SAM-dependent methyltransferase [Microbacterium timonense]|uniref:class I SAM-dependent methyltransferase n=1 Tax=Microbacterium timonense TaxID=2086576 RepID=UPI000D103768|nr:class I SAM-dependent methyltransferase [Microbacterium timonense]
MAAEFDRAFWENHWTAARGHDAPPAHPALSAELAHARPGTALDAGSGEGAEAAWLADHGWDVTAVDLSAHAVLRAASRPDAGSGVVRWVQADLTEWEPGHLFDLVTTFYAHPAMPQDAFYKRISGWVAPGGTLLIVGHHQADAHSRGGHRHPANAVTRPEQVRASLDPAEWAVRTAEVRERTVTTPGGTRRSLHDVIVRAERVRTADGLAHRR